MQRGDVGGPCWDGICGLFSPVEGSPFWLLLEQAHGLEVVVDIQGEAVVDPCRLVARMRRKKKRKKESKKKSNAGFSTRQKTQHKKEEGLRASDQNEEISRAHGDADPPVCLVPDIKVP